VAPARSRKLHQRGVGLGAVELQAHAAGLEVEAAECGDDAGRGRHLRGQVGLQAELAQRPRRLGSAGDLAHPGERLEKARAQPRFVPLDAGEDAAQALAGGEDQVIARAAGEAASERQDRRRIRAS